MNDDVCVERHKRIDERLGNHDIRLNNYSDRIDKLEQSQSEFKVEIKNLCENIKNLTSTMKWFMGIWVTSLLGFFFYAIQQNIFK
ncbi:hemolysin XhlA family protein [Clostridium sp. FP1]|uniref:hemolysin XhlA family protein n=1 Tax=Clostridium sp. FP1 TaxID=2724076 RepID=UPI0013E90B76|nr:hemolysin XhlA family protein [Clostridium sp. FP1]MBZ9633088.1 hemolysin XhlA family protein [Clostridium sp. FP1]